MSEYVLAATSLTHAHHCTLSDNLTARTVAVLFAN